MLVKLLMSALLAGQVTIADTAVRPVTVPPELASVTSNPEFSGIVWSKRRKRYLVVTDDSGRREQGSNHLPLLLGLSEQGALDPHPIPIRGVDHINDPESICAGPDDTFFLVTSHSPNLSNKTPTSRRQLLQLRDAGDAFAVIGRVDLTEVKGQHSLLSLVGLPPEGRLDIEAVTYHDGAIFIGFKSPLTDDGRAVVARLSEPLKALRTRQIAPASLTRFVAPALCVEVSGMKVCQGISDLLFLPDGSLVLAANAPKGGPKDHGGALWHLPAPVGKRPPLPLRRFSDLKPEGVTLSPSGRSLVVVFDRDQAEPEWAELPVPGAEQAR
jgi:hypothetical protein